MATDTTIRQAIRSRGHWRVEITPVDYEEERIDDLGELAQIVPQHTVALRGWDYPHIDTNSPVLRGLDWAGQDTAWQHHLDSWRVFTNGLFLSMNGLRDDWKDRSPYDSPNEDWAPGGALGVGDTIYTLTEVFEFATRLSSSPIGATAVVVSTKLVGAKDRALYVDNRGRGSLYRDYHAAIDEIPLQVTVARSALLAEAWDLAAVQARKLFQLFTWDCPLATIHDFQREMSEWSKSTPRWGEADDQPPEPPSPDPTA